MKIWTAVAIALTFGACGDADEPAPDSGPADAGTDAGADSETEATIGEPGIFDLEIEVDGVERSYVLDVPESAVEAMQEGPVPILFALHGAGDDGGNFIAATGLMATAADNGFVVVGPDGYNAGWFVEAGEGWPGADGYENSLQNDLLFVLEILEETRAGYWIDLDRAYAVGHSRGGGFTALLAILSGQIEIATGTYASPFAAYGVNAGYDPAQGQIAPALTEPKRPVWVIHGSADTAVPFGMGHDFVNELEDAEWDVTFTPIEGAGHTWLWSAAYGHSNQELWDYFAANPR